MTQHSVLTLGVTAMVVIAAMMLIFQPFFTTRSRGTGLGLAIVQKLVVTRNGRVTVSSSPRGGASFQLTFPLRAGDAETLTPDAVEVG